MAEISVVLPSYLEEENLRLLLPRLKAVMDGTKRSYEVIVVDTVQKLDATPDVCAQNGVRYLNRAPSNTFGDAVRTGIAAASGQWVIFMDADGSHAPEFIPQLLEQVPAHDVVIASRYIGGGHTENTWALRQMSRALNVSYSLILDLKVKDVSNSFKIYRADLLKELTLRCQNFDIIEEILFKISRAHRDVRIKEVPFTFKKRMFGETKRSLLLFILTYLFTMVKLRFDLGGGAKPSGPRRWPHVTLSLVVFLANMLGAGYRPIWADEAETAERARTVMESGWPRVIDKSGAVSLSTGGDEIEEGVTHRYTPWGQFYVGAAGLALGELAFLDRDASVRMPFIAAHAATGGLFSYGLAAFTGMPVPLALAAGAALSMQTVRTLHNRSARYHAVLDLLAVLGALALGAVRRGKRWGLKAWAVALFLSPHMHSMGGTVVAAMLGLWGVFVLWRELPDVKARVRAIVGYGVLPGAVSLALLVWLIRPGQHAHWGVMGPMDWNQLWPRSLSDSAAMGYVFPFVLASIAGLAALRRWPAAVLLAVTSVAVVVMLRVLDLHPFSQVRYYLAVPVLALAWPMALGLGDEQRRWVVKAAGAAVIATALAPELVVATLFRAPPGIPNPSTPGPAFPPFQGLRVIFSDIGHQFAGDRQPLHEAVALIRQRGSPADPVVFDYVPQQGTWYLHDHPVALLPDWTAKNPLNEHNPIWDRPPVMPRWHVWYAGYINGTWKCSWRCDYAISQLDGRRGTYVLTSRRLGQSVQMCIAGTWPTHQWNNAPFLEYLPESLTPSGPRTVTLVVGTPCPQQ